MVENYLTSFSSTIPVALQVAKSTMVWPNGYFSELEAETHLLCPPQLNWGLRAGRNTVTTEVSAADTRPPCTTFAWV